MLISIENPTKKIFKAKFYQKFGKRISDLLESNPEISSSIEKLESICNNIKYHIDGEMKEFIFEWD